MEFEFYKDALKFTLFMFFIAMIGFTMTVIFLISRGATPGVIARKSLDLITIVVPPALPATMSIGVGFALARLKQKKIFCTSPYRINISGKTNLAIFDKTGTLTEEGLEIMGIIEIQDGEFSNLIQEIEELPKQEVSLINLMATCHSIKSVHNKLVGDPLDLQMFS